MFEERGDTILSRWLEGKLTAEEQKAFERSTEFKEYQQIVQGMEYFKKPAINRKRLKEKIDHTLEELPKGKIIRLKPLYYMLGVVASILLIVGFFFNEVVYETKTGEKLIVQLPDDSKVHLNAKSKLAYSRFFWNFNKVVSLEGEAFFDIEKKGSFKVKTKSGTISVLGTEFNIKTREQSDFKLVCYEGKVAFVNTVNYKNEVLTAGEAIVLKGKQIEREAIKGEEPGWMKNKSFFNKALLKEIIEELQLQYNITVKNKTKKKDSHFTGSFMHNNLEVALKTVFIPMGISYEISKDKKEVLIK